MATNVSCDEKLSNISETRGRSTVPAGRRQHQTTSFIGHVKACTDLRNIRDDAYLPAPDVVQKLCTDSVGKDF